MLQNVKKFQMVTNIKKFYKILTNVNRYYQMLTKIKNIRKLIVLSFLYNPP